MFFVVFWVDIINWNVGFFGGVYLKGVGMVIVVLVVGWGCGSSLVVGVSSWGVGWCRVVRGIIFYGCGNECVVYVGYGVWFYVFFLMGIIMGNNLGVNGVGVFFELFVFMFVVIEFG